MHSYTFRDYPLEAACENAARFDWDGLELQQAHFDQDALEHDLPRCKEIAGRHGIPIGCVDFSGDFINDDPKIVEHSVERVALNLAICAQHGVLLMNGFTGFLVTDPTDFGKNGSALATGVHYDRAAEALRHLAEVAGRHGVRLALEIHMNTIHDTVASTARLLDLVKSPHIVANPDPGNLFATSTAEKDADALDKLEGRIGYFHFKNCVERDGVYDFSVRLAEGHIDFFKYVQKLVQIGYNGPVCVEYCGAGDPHVAAEQDIQYLRRCLEWAGVGVE